MADRLFAAEDSFPGFSEEETREEKLERILSYVYMLNEQYRYILCKLDADESDP